MKRRLFRLDRILVLAIWITFTGSLASKPSWSQDPPQLTQASELTQSRERTQPTRLRFAFDRAPWRDVIQWVAEQADLALHVNDLPTGSFTYSDSKEFTPEEAIDRINLFLLPEGFTLVRSGRLLTVIDLSDPRSMQQLDAMTELVSMEELDQHNDHEVVKCLFALNQIDPEEAISELSVLNLMSTPQVLSKTKQLMIIDTVAKLRNVKTVLDAFGSALSDSDTIVKSFPLKYVNADDVLEVARPHLGLATGEMIGIDVSLSADISGKNIFVTGVPDKVLLLEGLVKAIDQPETKGGQDAGESILQAHPIKGGNVEMVYNVLQTLMAGRSIRLSMDETAGSVVAFAPPSIQSEIAKTVQELEATDAEFEVIPLKFADPYFVISLLEEMLDLPDEFADPDEVDPHAPKIDADPAGMRLFVRAKRSQIEQIKKIVEGLDTDSGRQLGDQIRMLPLKGELGKRVLETGALFWRKPNAIMLLQSSDDHVNPSDVERVVGQDRNDPNAVNPNAVNPNATVSHDRRRDDDDRVRLASNVGSGNGLREYRLLTGNLSSDHPAVRCQLTPRGLLVECEDAEVLDAFESHLRLIAGPLDTIPSPPVTFYLRFTKADDALRMLAQLLDGGDAANQAEMGSLVNGYVGGTGSLLGSIVTARDGTSTLTVDSLTVVADSRLNRLIAQGTAAEIERIEDYLQIIDKDDSPTSIQTYGTSHVIELINTRAEEVAQAVRDAYAGRIAGPANAAASPTAGKTQAQPDKDNAKAIAKGSEKGTDGEKAAAKPGTPSRDLEPKMTVAVHEASNSLIITAPDALFREVEQLVKQIDSRAAQTLEVVTPVNGAVFETLLQEVLLNETSNASGYRPPTSGSSVSSRAASSSRPSSSRASSVGSTSKRDR